jgi:hypothetical protein
MSQYYPKIATLKYEDRHIKIKIPIRIKIVGLQVHICDNCGADANRQKLITYIRNERAYWVSRYKERADEINQYCAPFEVRYNDRNEPVKPPTDIHCPNCLWRTNESKKVLMRLEEKKILKVYSNMNPDYIKVSRLLTEFSGFVFSSRKKGAVSCFVKSLKEAKDIIRNYQKRLKHNNNMMKSTQSVKLVEHKVSMKELKEQFDAYRVRKFARAI